MPQCACCPTAEPRRKFRPIALLFNVLLAYALLVVGGGTLINTGHPVAMEAGRLLQVVTFVDPTISWAYSHGYGPLAHGIQVLSHGIPL